MYGPFEVIERLGIGGMATVHRAIERGIEGFERVVALKRLLPHLAEDEAFVRAFVREAKLASLLQHANIVQLYELGRVGTSYFISMEYIRGRDVRRVLRQAKRVTGPLPVPIAVAIIGELLDALDYAHTRTDEEGNPLGLVHRDISPSNLLISHTGHLKVIDFGIAKATLGHLATHTGRIKGKLSYMAPEALTGKSSLDNRSDLFSASIIAHELLTAHPLFAARNDFHTIERVQSMQAPPPSERNPEVPPALDALVLRGLSKDPAQRWRNAGEMRAALADVTTRHRLTCTNREVADWVEIAFALGHSQELAPGSRLSLSSPVPQRAQSVETTSGGGTMPLGLVPRPPDSSDDEGDSDEILDLVWDSSDGEGAPILIDEVPDVSLRFTLADPIDDDDDPTSMRDISAPVPRQPRPQMSARAASDPLGDGDARITFKPPSVPPPIAAASGELSTVPESSPRPSTVSLRGSGGRGKRLRAPSEWATGTSPANNRPSRRALGAQGTGPTEALCDGGDQVAPALALRLPTSVDIGGGIVNRELGPSRVWWVMGAVAVGAVIGLVAWAATGHDSTPKAAAKPAAPAAAATASASAAPEAPTPVVAPVPASEPPAMHIHAAEVPTVATSEKKKKSHGSDAPAAHAAAVAAAAPVATPAAVPAPMEPTLTRAPSLLDAALRPLPVPVKTPPATSKAHAFAAARPASPASAEPMLVPPTRAHKRSGSLPILRGSKNAAPLRAITAKLCVDRGGSVTSVKILSKADSDVRDGLEQALSRWHYDPIVESGSAVPACFATTFRVTQR